MGYSKTQKILFALLCLFIILFPFWCVRGLCAESEEVDMTYVDGLTLSTSYMEVISASNYRLYYLELEQGYNYNITINYPSNSRIGFTNSIDVGSSVYNLTFFTEPGTYNTLIDGSQIQYVFFDVSMPLSDTITYTITRTKRESMSGAVDDLSYYAGTNIWESFTNSLPFVLPLVLVCFGMYIIAHFVNKNSKGV